MFLKIKIVFNTGRICVKYLSPPSLWLGKVCFDLNEIDWFDLSRTLLKNISSYVKYQKIVCEVWVRWLYYTWPLVHPPPPFSPPPILTGPKPYFKAAMGCTAEFLLFQPFWVKNWQARHGAGILVSTNMISSYLELFSVKLILSK